MTRKSLHTAISEAISVWLQENGDGPTASRLANDLTVMRKEGRAPGTLARWGIAPISAVVDHQVDTMVNCVNFAIDHMTEGS